MTARLVVLCAAFVTAACSKTAAPEPPPPDPKPVTTTTTSAAPSATPSASSADASAKGPDDIGYDAPKAWTLVPVNNPMRKATYKIPRAAGDVQDAEMTVAVAFGGVHANVQRWSDQFQGAQPTTERRHPNGLDVTVVEMEGIYISGGPVNQGEGPKDNFALLGAIVQGGDKQHFFKLVGPSRTVKAAKKDFDALVASMRAK